MKTLIIRQVPEVLHKKLKLAAVQRDVTMNALLIKSIENIVQPQDKEPN